MDTMKLYKENGKKAVSISTSVIVYIIMITIACILIFPYIWMVLSSLKSPEEITSQLRLVLFPADPMWGNYKEIWTVIPFMSGVWNTVKVEVSVIVIGTFVSALAAFAFAKLRLPGKNFWLLFLMSGMMVPYAALMMPQYRAFFALKMTDTLWPLILPGFFGNISMMFFLIQYMKTIPNAIIEAAKIDGASYMKIFLSIMLPLIKTAIAAQVIFWFTGIWNDYFAPAIYLTTPERMTLQPLIDRLNSSLGGGDKLPLIMAGAVLSSIPMLVIYTTCQKFFVESMAISGVKG